MKWYQYNIQNLSDAEYEKWYALLDVAKKQRINQFHFTADKKRTVVSEMLARQAIAQWCHVPEEMIIFTKNNYGKPFAKDLPVEFNVSHSGNLVVCAIDEKPVGIDVEQIRPIDLKVAKRICCQDELIYLFGYLPSSEDFRQTADDAMLIRFFEIWTAKEAYFKRLGTGIQGFTALREHNVLNMQRMTYPLDGYMLSIMTT